MTAYIYIYIHFVYIFFLLGFYVTPTQYRSFGDVPALLVKEDLRCPYVYFFRHKRAPEKNH
jgi:hypothetical protein